MCQSIRNGGKRCPSQRPDSKAIIRSVAKQFGDTVSEKFVNTVFCSLIKENRKSTESKFYFENLELHGYTKLDGGKPEAKVCNAQVLLLSRVKQLSSMVRAHLDTYEKANPEKFTSANSEITHKLDKLKISTKLGFDVASYLADHASTTGEEPKYDQLEMRNAKFLGKLYYEAKAGRVILKSGSRFGKSKAYYHSVPKEVIENIQNDAESNPTVILSRYHYENEEQGISDRITYKCEQCGRFRGNAHVCEKPKKVFPKYAIIQELVEGYDPYHSDPNGADLLENHNLNYRKRQKAWQRVPLGMLKDEDFEHASRARIMNAYNQDFEATPPDGAMEGLFTPSKGGRTFGVEIELSFDNEQWDTRHQNMEEIKKEIFSAGLNQSNWGYPKSGISAHDPDAYDSWVVTDDASGPGIIEFVSPVMAGHKVCMDEMEGVLSTAKKYGATVQGNCGGHVNIGSASYSKNPVLYGMLQDFNTRYDAHVEQLVIGSENEEMRGSSHYAGVSYNRYFKPFGEGDILDELRGTLNEGKKKAVNVYKALSSNPNPRSEYVEFRKPNASTDLEEWRKRILLMGTISDYVEYVYRSGDSNKMAEFNRTKPKSMMKPDVKEIQKFVRMISPNRTVYNEIMSLHKPLY